VAMSARPTTPPTTAPAIAPPDTPESSELLELPVSLESPLLPLLSTEVGCGASWASEVCEPEGLLSLEVLLAARADMSTERVLADGLAEEREE
jgi:hypothetical protein